MYRVEILDNVECDVQNKRFPRLSQKY